jgi:uncharacterized damage-inducible protein DinB
MFTVNDSLAFGLTSSQALLMRYVADLTAAEFLHRPSPNANCAAWTVGHLALTDRRSLARLGAPQPELPEGFDRRFLRGEGCPQAAEFGDARQIVAVFDEHRNRLVAAVRAATAAQLDQKLDKPIAMASTVGEALSFVAVHTAMHAGQIVMIRRSLGRPPLI